MLYVTSKPLGAWFRYSGDMESGSPLDRTFLTLLMCAALWILFRRKFDWLGAIKENVWLIVLIVFMLVSVSWSDIPYISFKRWTREFQAIVIAFVILSERSPHQAIEAILRRTAYILIPFSLILIKYFPEYGVSYGRYGGGRMWVGVALQKNSLGHLCLISAFFLVWSLVRERQRHNPRVSKYQTPLAIFLIAMTLVLMGGPGWKSYSATSIVALAVGLLVYWRISSLKKRGTHWTASTLVAIVAALIVFGIFILFAGGSSIEFIASAAGRDATLTGRTGIWAVLLPIAMQKPFMGRGFGSYWTTTTTKLAPHAHNGYLDLLLGLGFVGIVLVSMFLLSSCRKAHQTLMANFDWGTLWICYLIMLLICNITESSMNSFTRPLTALILFLTVSSANVFSARNQS